VTKILCIEDEVDFRATMVDFLQMEGFETDEAGDGEEGLEKIAELEPDIVISDINMPKLNGYDMLTALRVEHPEKANVPFLFLTANSQIKDHIKGKRLGASDYLTKPIDFDLLLASIESKLAESKRYRSFIDTECNHYKSLILQMISHELRTPLNTIIGFGDMLANQVYGPVGDAKYAEFISNITDSSYELQRLVNNAIDSTALIAGDFQLQKTLMHVGNLIHDVLPYANQWAEPQGVSLEYHIDQAVELINVDMTCFHRMLSTVILECAKLTPRGGRVQLDVSLSPNGKTLLFTVMDGSVFDDKKYHDFQPIDLDSPGDTSGLTPLSIGFQFARAVMRAHGGSIDLQESVDNKQAVILCLPLES
jgi:CheY-like chemotaxis protein